MFNRREQLALLLLSGSLLVGSGLAMVDYFRPAALEEFRVVPAAVETPVPAAAAAVPAGPLDLNAATADQLQQLPMIGPKLAARILAHRQQRGPFRRPEDLRQVSGIGPRTVEKLRRLVVCGVEKGP
jgi:competence protein ComEA